MVVNLKLRDSWRGLGVGKILVLSWMFQEYMYGEILMLKEMLR